MLTIAGSVLAVAALASLTAAPAGAPSEQAFLRSRDGTHATGQLFSKGFATLKPRERLLAWHLGLAAHAGEPIAFDQLGWNALAVKRLLEGTYLFGLEGSPAPFAQKLESYLLRFYGHTGNHDHYTSQKFLPEFTPEQLADAARRAFAQGAPFGVKDAQALEAWLAELRPTLFDPAFETHTTMKRPPPGQDLITASSNTAYGKGVTLKDLEGLTEKNPLNSRVVKVDDKLVEQVFRAGTPDQKIPPGLYAKELERVIGHLQAALRHAEPAQKKALDQLIRYFRTGELADWDAYNIAWLRSDARVDSNLGFIETYVDARGQKGQWEALINYRDDQENRLMQLLARKVQYFEDRMPWPDAYKRKKISPPVAKAINLLANPPMPPAGINLPNEQHVREKYGSKSVQVMNTMETAHHLVRLPLSIEFANTAEEAELARKHGATARKLLVAFHEVIGHASGKVDPKVKDVSRTLKEFDNTLEESRADLVALWFAFDPSLKALYPDHEEVGRQMYRDFVVEAVTTLRRVEKGTEFEEDHQRGHAMTAGYLVEKGVIRYVVREENGQRKTSLQVLDYAKMHEAVGELLSTLMVIKATGDYEGIKALVEKHGIRFDPKLRDEVVARVKGLQIPTVLLMTSPRLVATADAQGSARDARVSHEQGFLAQQLERSYLGALAPAQARAEALRLGALDDRALFDELRKKLRQPPPEAETAPPAGKKM